MDRIEEKEGKRRQFLSAVVQVHVSQLLRFCVVVALWVGVRRSMGQVCLVMREALPQHVQELEILR